MNYRVTLLAGGLGNQLFQVAYNLSDPNVKHRIIDTTFFHYAQNENKTPEVLEYDFLEKFELVAGNSRLILARPFRLMLRLSTKSNHSFFEFFLIKIAKFMGMAKFSFKYKQRFSITQALGIGYKTLPAKRSEVSIGYFQSYKWIESNSDALQSLRELKLHKQFADFFPFQVRASRENPLGVHIRLGDYLNERSIGILPRKYYQDALRFQFKNFDYGRIWLFSNDPEVALTYFPEDLIHLVDVISNEYSSVETLEIMKLCTGYVIANSTFSWWGAFLSHNQSAIVACPEKWFERMDDPVMITPPSWHKIESFGLAN
jgi:hypothetical protein